MERNLICIGCPMGCDLRAVVENGQMLSVQGNICPRGQEYARNECLRPMRMVTSTLPVSGGKYPTTPLKTSREVPKDKVMECIACLRGLQVVAPVSMGQVVLSDVAGTGADFIATRTVPEV